jgi:hypothetical protein
MKSTVLLLSPVGMPVKWLYLKSFDVDANGGRGQIALTARTRDAMKFSGPGEAMATWRTQSKVLPLRPDGKPNRPLTAYHAQIENVP